MFSWFRRRPKEYSVRGTIVTSQKPRDLFCEVDHFGSGH
jgi:hypothetical protein